MSIHPKDAKSANPRLQCSVCGKWKRGHRKTEHPNHPGWTQNFYGSCAHNDNGDHLAGDHADVCVDCCDKACAALARSKP
jgi:hypothetical protein